MCVASRASASCITLRSPSGIGVLASRDCAVAAAGAAHANASIDKVAIRIIVFKTGLLPLKIEPGRLPTIANRNGESCVDDWLRSGQRPAQSHSGIKGRKYSFDALPIQSKFLADL
jgi:hypothetical protein